MWLADYGPVPNEDGGKVMFISTHLVGKVEAFRKYLLTYGRSKWGWVFSSSA